MTGFIAQDRGSLRYLQSPVTWPDGDEYWVAEGRTPMSAHLFESRAEAKATLRRIHGNRDGAERQYKIMRGPPRP